MRAMADCCRTRYRSVTEAPHNTGSSRVNGEEAFAPLKPECVFKDTVVDLSSVVVGEI